MCVFLVCFAEPREKTGKEREIGEREEREGWEEKGKPESKRGIGKNRKENKRKRVMAYVYEV